MLLRSCFTLQCDEFTERSVCQQFRTRARESDDLFRQETPDFNFIKPVLWPPNSQDLKPAEYMTWATIQERLFQTKLKQRLTDA